MKKVVSNTRRLVLINTVLPIGWRSAQTSKIPLECFHCRTNQLTPAINCNQLLQEIQSAGATRN